MMFARILGFCAFAFTWRWGYAGDPCSEVEYSLLPRADYRGGGCEFNIDKQVCDAALSTGWYRAIGRAGDLKMQDLEPDFFTCGTKYPIWMTGSHPNSTEGEVEGTLRQVLTGDTWSIKVKNCQDEYYVYELQPTDSCPEAYCFGVNATDSCPPFDPCDIYEYEYVSYDPERSGSCSSSVPDVCDLSVESFTSAWVVFRDSDQGFMNVSNTPLSVGACGSASPMWIKETISTATDGIKTQKLCIASEHDNCATETTIRSKSCTWFMVYETPINTTCGRLCLDDPEAACVETVQDPCDASVYKELPRAEYRGGACIYNDQKQTCDAALSSGWYRAIGENGSLKMQDTLADLLTCGTKFPIWLNGSHPSVSDGEVEVTLLQVGSDEVIIAKVKNCNDEYYVYKLEPTAACPEAYCFGSTNSDPCPPFDPCDIYEHTKIKYDAARSSACSSGSSDKCIEETFPSPWVAFYDFKETAFLNVSRSSSGVGACGSLTPMWIKETLSTASSGIATEAVCTETSTSSCGTEIHMRSKTCKWFTVYEPPDNVECSRLCLDDPEPICPAKPTDRNSTHESGRDDVKDGDNSSKEYLWIIAGVLSIAIALLGIAAAFIIYHYRKYFPQSQSNKAKHYICGSDISHPTENTYTQRLGTANSQLAKQIQIINIATTNPESSKLP